MLEKYSYDAPKHFEVVEAVGVGAWVIGKEEPEEGENAVLESKGEPVDIPP